MAYIVAFIDVKSLDPGGFIEFKVESDQVGERKSGRITTVGRYELPGVPENKIELGDSNQNIWFWWDTLQGKVILSIDVNGDLRNLNPQKPSAKARMARRATFISLLTLSIMI